MGNVALEKAPTPTFKDCVSKLMVLIAVQPVNESSLIETSLPWIDKVSSAINVLDCNWASARDN